MSKVKKTPKANKFIKVRAEKNGVVEVDIFGVIGDSFFEEGNTMKGLKAEIKAAKPKEVLFNVATMGGSALEGLDIHDLIASLKVPTTTRAVGAVASAGSVLLQGGGKREMSKNQLLLIHNSRGLIFGEAKDAEAAAKEMRLIDSRMLAIFAQDNDKSTEKELKALMDEDRFIDAEEARDMGLIDEVVDPSEFDAKYDMKAIAACAGLTDKHKEFLADFYAEEDDDSDDSEDEDEDDSSDENSDDDDSGDSDSDEDSDDDSGDDDNDDDSDEDEDSDEDSDDDDSDEDDDEESDEQDEDDEPKANKIPSHKSFLTKLKGLLPGAKKHKEPIKKTKKPKKNAKEIELEAKLEKAQKEAKELKSKLFKANQKKGKKVKVISIGDAGVHSDEDENMPQWLKDKEKDAEALRDHEM